MLDSGAFTFMCQKNIKIDWDTYLLSYANFINDNNINLFFELDIDAIIGVKSTSILRDKLIKLTNKQPIWVLQQGRTLEDFIKASKEYKYVAIPLSGKTKLSKYRRTLKPCIDKLCDIAHSNGAKIHGLGFTSLDLPNYNFDSVDSTAWIYGVKASCLYRFNNNKMIKLDKPEGYRYKSTEIMLHNFSEWSKFSNCLENNKYGE
jgi:hypothetical protein